MKTFSIWCIAIFFIHFHSFGQIYFCGEVRIDKKNEYCKNIDDMIECADKSSKADKKEANKIFKDNLVELKEIIKDGVVSEEKEKINGLLNELKNSSTDCMSENNPDGKNNNQILDKLKELIDSKVVSNKKGINWFGWFFFIAFLISLFFHLYKYLVLHQFFKKRNQTKLVESKQSDLGIQNIENGDSTYQNEEKIRKLNEELEQFKEKYNRLHAEYLDLKNSSELKKTSEVILNEIYPAEEKMIDLPIEPSAPVKILFHHDIETDGKSLKVAKATSKQTAMSLYEIKVENDNHIRLWVIESPQVTKMLIDYSRKQLEPLFNIPSEPSPSVTLIKTKQPAIFKREGEIWVLDSKGSVEYI